MTVGTIVVLCVLGVLLFLGFVAAAAYFGWVLFSLLRIARALQLTMPDNAIFISALRAIPSSEQLKQLVGSCQAQTTAINSIHTSLTKFMDFAFARGTTSAGAEVAANSGFFRYDEQAAAAEEAFSEARRRGINVEAEAVYGAQESANV